MKEHEVTLSKPMGIIFEEDEANPDAGTVVKRIDPHGQTAAACRFDPEGVDICVRDTVIEVNGRDVKNKSLEDIMQMIMDGPQKIELVLSRPADAVVVCWPNGISVAAKPGDSFGFIAQHEAFINIPYSCTNGGCGSCEQSILSEDGGVSVIARVYLIFLTNMLSSQSLRYIRPCVARVGKGSPAIIVNPSDRFAAP